MRAWLMRMHSRSSWELSSLKLLSWSPHTLCVSSCTSVSLILLYFLNPCMRLLVIITAVLSKLSSALSSGLTEADSNQASEKTGQKEECRSTLRSLVRRRSLISCPLLMFKPSKHVTLRVSSMKSVGGISLRSPTVNLHLSLHFTVHTKEVKCASGHSYVTSNIAVETACTSIAT